MFHMMKQASESLAGRVAVIPMQGLSNSEIEGSTGGAFTGDPSEWTRITLHLWSFTITMVAKRRSRPHFS